MFYGNFAINNSRSLESIQNDLVLEIDNFNKITNAIGVLEENSIILNESSINIILTKIKRIFEKIIDFIKQVIYKFNLKIKIKAYENKIEKKLKEANGATITYKCIDENFFNLIKDCTEYNKKILKDIENATKDFLRKNFEFDKYTNALNGYESGDYKDKYERLSDAYSGDSGENPIIEKETNNINEIKSCLDKYKDLIITCSDILYEYEKICKDTLANIDKHIAAGISAGVNNETDPKPLEDYSKITLNIHKVISTNIYISKVLTVPFSDSGIKFKTGSYYDDN